MHVKTSIPKLNPSQQLAVEYTGGPTLVLAGAGAGKTRVLTRRVAHLIRVKNIDPTRILVVTFTNKAAREMKERLGKELGEETVKMIWAGTFHSICCRILRQDIEALDLGYTKKFTIFDPKSQEKAMDRAIRHLNFDPKDYKASQLLYQISKLKNSGIPIKNLNPRQFEDPFHAKILAHYQSELVRNNALDFDDLIQLTVELLEHHPEVCQRFQQRFEHILVDEYQDTNTVQFEMVHTLGQVHRNVFVVGDVDQSIYSFRHANFRIILRFQEDYPDAKIIKLEENYRSTGHILAAANDLIQGNSERFEKVLKPTRGMGNPLRFHMAIEENEEATYVAQTIQRFKDANRLSYGDFAILYRTNAQSRLFEQKLVQFNIPYHIVGGFRFYDRREIKDMLSYLQVIYNPQDSLTLRRILNIPKRGLGPKAIEILETSATFEGKGLTLWEAIQTESVACQISFKAQEALEVFVDDMHNWVAASKNKPVSELIELIFEESGYKAEILEKEKDEQRKEDRLGNVQALVQAAIEFEERAKDPCDLGGFLEKIALYSDTDQLKKEGKVVTLMTVHSSKGLEYPVVFLPSLEEGIFPHIRSIMEGEKSGAIEEERRLMYVALTRAQNQLFLCCSQNRRSKRASMANRPSRFLLELRQHIELPGTLLAEAHKHQQEQRMKRMNIRTSDELANPKPQEQPLSALEAFSRQIQAPRVADQPISTPTPAQALMHKPRVSAGSLNLQVGDKVQHPQWGVGEVKKVIAPLAKVAFSQGEKTLNMKAAPLTKTS